MHVLVALLCCLRGKQWSGPHGILCEVSAVDALLLPGACLTVLLHCLLPTATHLATQHAADAWKVGVKHTCQPKGAFAGAELMVAVANRCAFGVAWLGHLPPGVKAWQAAPMQQQQQQERLSA